MQKETDFDQDKAMDFYKKLRQKIKAWSISEEGKTFAWTNWILLGPDLFHLLIRLAADPNVPIGEKAKCERATCCLERNSEDCCV